MSRPPSSRRDQPDHSDDGEGRARRAALGLLARRELSEQQVRRALAAQRHAPAAVEAALRGLRQQHYLDDAGLATRYARSRLEFHGLGRNRIRQGLGKRGVARAIIEKGLGEALAEVSEADVLDRLARRYWRQRRGHAPPRRLRGLWAFLLRRGFPAALVHERLRALWPRWADALQGLEPYESE